MNTSFIKGKFSVLLPFIFLFIFFSNCKESVKKDISPENKSIASKADLYITKLTELNQFNGAVLLRKNNEVLLYKSYNMSNDKDSSISVNTSFRFTISHFTSYEGESSLYTCIMLLIILLVLSTSF